jgi:hypothetical protein
VPPLERRLRRSGLTKAALGLNFCAESVETECAYNSKSMAEKMLKQNLNGRTEGLVFRSKRNTPLVNCTVLNKHLHPLLRKLGLERGGMHGFRHHRASTLVMAGTPNQEVDWAQQRRNG